MIRLARYGWPCAALVALTWLAIAIQLRGTDPAPPPPPLDDWDIPQLAEHLNRAGLPVRLLSTQKNGRIGYTAFLTMTDKEFDDLNALAKVLDRIQQWHGTIYCERGGKNDSANLLQQWGEYGWAAGPFVFYGDTQLLDRIRAALAPLASR
jgi:hypothetical protein